MTDPRIAALAEALTAVSGPICDARGNPDYDEYAASILAALPYGWDPDGDEDWRRLRRIEEAARAMRVARERKAMAGPDLTASIVAEQRLYAALEE